MKGRHRITTFSEWSKLTAYYAGLINNLIW